MNWRRRGKQAFLIWLAAELLAVLLAISFGQTFVQDAVMDWNKPSLEQREQDAKKLIAEMQADRQCPTCPPSAPQPPPPEPDFAFDPVLSKWATIVAMQKVRILCPTWEEFSDSGEPEGVLGWTYSDVWRSAVVTWWDGQSLCGAARALPTAGVYVDEDGVERQYTKQVLALGALVITHEAYHLRVSWISHHNEAKVQCKAIRHFRVAVQLLGGSRALADKLMPVALAEHGSLPLTYQLAACRLPSP